MTADPPSLPRPVAPGPLGVPGADALRFVGVDLDRVGTGVLSGIDWTVTTEERWVVLGPNGSGKTTLFQLASGYLHPTRGTVEIIGHRLGRVDVRRLRERIGLVSASISKMLVPDISALDAVVSARYGALEPWWHEYGDDEWATARRLLADAGFAHIVERPIRVLSEGERQQVLLARSLMNQPALLLLDEPAAGLDVGGRERLVGRLGRLARDPGAPPTVLITHHVEEIPVGFTHVLLLRDGVVVTAGPLQEHLRADSLSDTFGLALTLERAGGRWSCRAS
jgi:iron complex transport system ATP-binding protein